MHSSTLGDDRQRFHAGVDHVTEGDTSRNAASEGATGASKRLPVAPTTLRKRRTAVECGCGQTKRGRAQNQH